jgi:hypothetical protein
MNAAKVQHNVNLFLAEGWKLAKEKRDDYPVVFQEVCDERGNVYFSRRMYVREDVTPETLNDVILTHVPSPPGPIKRIEPA